MSTKSKRVSSMMKFFLKVLFICSFIIQFGHAQEATKTHIVKKGEGAYFSSGSRPNQTPQSWGLARLASSITSGKAAAVDYDIIKKGCNHKKRAFILANKSRKKYKYDKKKVNKNKTAEYKKLTKKSKKRWNPCKK